jgi:ABC-type glycerol-3-phosphate transport system substrate-binding protein
MIMKIRPTLLIMLVLLVIAGMPLFSSGEQEGDGAAAGELSGTFDFWHPFTQKTRMEDLEISVKEFEEAYPAVDVVVEIVPFPKIPEKWATAVAANTIPDVMGTTPWNAMDAHNAGKLIPADNIAKRLGGLEAFISPQGIRDALEYKGTLLALPLYANTRLLIYRRDLLEQAGVTPPEKWEEYLDAAAKLTDPPNQYGMVQMWDPGDVGATMYHQLFSSSNDGWFFDDDGNPTMTNKANMETIEFMVELYKVGSPPKEFGFTYRDVFNLFTSGKSVMVLNSGFMMNAYENRLPEMPELQGKNALAIGKPPFNKRAAGNASYTPIMQLKGDQEALGEEFIVFLFDTERYTRWTHALPGAMLPTLTSVFESEEYWENERIQKYKDGISNIIVALKNPGYWPDKISENISVVTDFGIIETMYQKIALGRMSIEEAAAEAQAELEQKIKERAR